MTTLPYSEFLERYQKIAVLDSAQGFAEMVYSDSRTRKLCIVLEYTGLDKETRNELFKEFLLTYSPKYSLKLLHFTGKKAEKDRNLILIFDHSKRLSDLVTERLAGYHSGHKEKADSPSGLSYREIADIFKRIRDGLRFLHEKASFHGDIRKEKVYIDQDMKARILKYPRMKKNYEVANEKALAGEWKEAKEVLLSSELTEFLSFNPSILTTDPQSSQLPLKQSLNPQANQPTQEQNKQPTLNILQAGDLYSLSLLACTYLFPPDQPLPFPCVDPSSLIMAIEACSQALGHDIAKSIKEGFGVKGVDKVNDVSALSLNEFEPEVKQKDELNVTLQMRPPQIGHKEGMPGIDNPKRPVSRDRIKYDNSPVLIPLRPHYDNSDTDSLAQDIKIPQDQLHSQKSTPHRNSSPSNPEHHPSPSPISPATAHLPHPHSPPLPSMPVLSLNPRLVPPSRLSRSPPPLPSSPTSLHELRQHCINYLNNCVQAGIACASTLVRRLGDNDYSLKLPIPNNSSGQAKPVGFVYCQDGSVYYGFVSNLLPEDAGIMFGADGSVYHGLFRRGKREGFGTWLRAKGGVVVGNWKAGQLQGEAMVKTRSGEKGRGKWADGKVIDWKEEGRQSSQRSRSGSRGPSETKELEAFYRIGFLESQVLKLINANLQKRDSSRSHHKHSQDSRFGPLLAEKMSPIISPRIDSIDAANIPEAFYRQGSRDRQDAKSIPANQRGSSTLQHEILSSLNRLHEKVVSLSPDKPHIKSSHKKRDSNMDRSRSKHKPSPPQIDYLYNDYLKEGDKRKNMLDCLSEEEEIENSGVKASLRFSRSPSPQDKKKDSGKPSLHPNQVESGPPKINAFRLDHEPPVRGVRFDVSKAYPALPDKIVANPRVGVGFEVVDGSLHADELDPDFTGFAQVMYPEGGRFYGQFVLGLAHGSGIYYSPRGNTLRGRWEKGRLVAQALP